MHARARLVLPPLLLAAACAAPRAVPPAAQVPAGPAFDVEHVALDLELDPAARALRGTCRLRLWPARAGLNVVELDLVGLEVETVTDTEGRGLSHEHRDGKLRVQLSAPTAAEEYVEVVVRYGGRPVKGLYFAGDRGAGPTQAWTHGQCSDARAWFPCVDEPWERATSELTVRVPRGWSVIAAGERLERREDGAGATETWRTTFPHPAYLQTLVAGEFALLESTRGGIPLLFAAEPRLAPQLEAAWGETGAILAFLGSVTGARYPYPKYAQTAVDGFLYGGMENLSATTLHAGAVSDPAGLLDDPPTGLVAHEAAHQWFGNLVTCADWSHAWLHEGFATYYASRYTAHARGADEFLLEMDDHRAGWLARDIGANRRPLVHLGPGDPILSFLSGHVYQGGAVRLHHLRRLLGDEAFDRGVRRFVGLNAGRSVVTDDLRRALEESSGRDLAAHFRRWFEGLGHARVEFAARHDAVRGELVIEVRQVQDDAPFPLLLEVEVATAAGVRVERFELAERAGRLRVPQLAAPRWARLDPACALPGTIVETRTFAEWLELLRWAPDAAGRRNAARVLARHVRDHADAGVRAALAHGLAFALEGDASPAVRRAALEALGRPRTAVERERLLLRAEQDPDAAVRAAAFRALEPVGTDAADPGTLAELARVARAEIARAVSHAATGAALGALVRAERAAALEFLVAELAVPSAHGQRAARVLAEIGRLPDPRATAVLRAAALDESLPDPARRAALAALGPRAARDAGVRADLLSILDTPRSALRLEALAALGQARASDVEARVRLHARTTHDARERVAALRVLAGAP
ncbi:MAG: HEAT repeat domain-containing protein [Planctomycetes bacterium]|nr:HEAT repeat domain-containing protein [Planctomycetota bacterium]